MSLQATANLLQQQGRGDDKMLVHMTPREVAGLEAIAKAKGGQLTINPQTGLPEAGFLDDVLPIAASAALMYFGGPIGASIGEGLGLSGALAQGVGMGLLTGGATTLLTGDVNKGLKAGLLSGALSGAMAGTNAPTEVTPTSNVQTSTPALDVAKNVSPGISNNTAVADFANASKDPIGSLYESGALSGGAGQTSTTVPADKSWWGSLSPRQQLATGLAGTAGVSLLGSAMKPKMPAVARNEGTIRPYEYQTSKTEPTPYFQPVQYGLTGPTSPLDTSERTYFNQSYTALPTYKAAAGGEVPPNLDHMQPGGLAAIQGMRDGYAPVTTPTGDIPQMAAGGAIAFRNRGQVEGDDESIFDLQKKLEELRAMNYVVDNKIEEAVQAKNSTPEKAMMQRLAMSQPDSMRGIGQIPMGMVQDAQMRDRFTGNDSEGFSVNPNLLTPKMVAGSAQYNKQLDDDTRLKLMAAGHSGQQSRGVDRFGAGLSRNLGRDSDISAFYEKTPGFNDKMYGVRYNQRFAGGGSLGGYSDGGRMLKGPGDGMSDSIPGTINNKQPARLADGEFVVPADVVSHLGNGSTDAGAKRLYDMMDRVRKARTGTKKQGKQIKADKYLPK